MIWKYRMMGGIKGLNGGNGVLGSVGNGKQTVFLLRA